MTKTAEYNLKVYERVLVENAKGDIAWLIHQQ